MPRIDPQQLLKTLGILLSPSGGIKSSEEVDRLVKLMSKFSRKLVSKCIYVQILKATPSELLSKFLVEGGWQLLNTWFDDAIKSHNWPLVREMLHLFQFCPMTAELLKENANEHQAPKLINQLRQESSIQADIRGLALDIYKSWVAVVSQPPIKTIEQSSHPGALPDFDSSDDEVIDPPTTKQDEPSSGPVSLLQSLADEVSESIKKEKEVEDDDTDDDEDDPDILALKKRFAPTVKQPMSKIIDASVKINKKNLPPPEKKSRKNSSIDPEEIATKPEKRRRSSETLSKSPSLSKNDRSKRFRPDGIRDEVNPEEKQRIKDKARKMLEEAQNKKSLGSIKPMGGITSTLGKIPRIPKVKTLSTSSLSSLGPETNDKKVRSFEDMLGGLDSKPKTVKTPMVKNKTAALLEGMKKSSSTSSLSSSSKSSSSKSSTSSSSSSSHKKDHHHSSSSKKDHHRDHRDRDRDGHKSSSSSSKRDSKDSKSSDNHKKLSLTMPDSPHSSSKKSKHPSSESESPKVSSAKSPTVNYAESSGFMDAIFSSMGVPSRKKKRKNSLSKDEDSSKTGSPSGKSSGNTTGTPPKVAKKDPDSPTQAASDAPDVKEPKKEPAAPTFSFYQDTQDIVEKEEETPAPKDTEAKEESDVEAVKTEDSDSEQAVTENGNTPHNDDEIVEAKPEAKPNGNDIDSLPFEEPESMPREVKGILVYHRGRGKRDKKITWRPESQLVEVEYFEVDENERVNVNKLKFENLRQMESKFEKAAMNSKTEMSDDETPLLQWYKPRPIKVTNRESFTPGEKSKEKETQTQREKNVLAVIYFSRSMTPETPSEADPERDTTVMKNIEPCLIPTEDKEADENSDFQYGQKGWPEPKQNEVSKQASLETQFNLPPALTNLLSSIHKGGLGAIIPPPSIQKSLSQEEQDTLAAQMEAVKQLTLLTSGNPAAIPAVLPLNEPPPGHGVPPAGIPGNQNTPPHDFQRIPPPGVPPPFGGAAPRFGGPPPRQNGFSQQGPPTGPPPSFGGYQNRNGRGGGSDNYQRGGYKTGGGPPHQNRGGPPHQNRGGHYRDNNHRDNRNEKPQWNNRNNHGNNHHNKGRPCKFFAQHGTCRDGDSCRFTHEQQSARN